MKKGKDLNKTQTVKMLNIVSPYGKNYEARNNKRRVRQIMTEDSDPDESYDYLHGSHFKTKAF